jgi:flagellin-like protein
MKKKSQSEIVGNVLLILIVVAAIVILGNLIVPMIERILGKSSGCFDTSNKIRIEEGKYTCYNKTATEMYVKIHIEDVEIKGFKIELSGIKSKTVEITEGKDGKDDKVTMFLETFTLNLPPKNGANVYNFSAIAQKPDSIKVYPILKNGNVCESSHSINIVNDCFEV